ncbi:FKBP-type peptidyl-prolyl cis-trans isomerase [Marinobacterium arenosum]|uniref:FKBP-type peptidyl-prolyl cis-trans isomerase n=1 Tax=Marinobacterium arenosum TaxID=2862496 RepID=UPI001C98B0CC|nr:peptidylprolyl isomerase [Marinobacterium arenosum]MBY4678013.1 peptidylprolyl isomerase [Marinobacterium arenosum]
MKISADKVVAFHYTLSDAQQQVLDDSHDGEPLPYLHGHRNIIPGLENALEGREAGDSFRVEIHPDQGYGRRDNGLVQTIKRSEFGDAELAVGMHYQVQDEEGQQQLVEIVELSDDEVTVDGNHPLAGHTLTYDIEVVSVRDATTDELAQGRTAL